MKWESSLVERLQWSDTITNRESKEQLARMIAMRVQEGEIIGAGSGSTVYLALLAIAERIRTENLHVTVIPASMEISMECVRLGIPQTTLWMCRPDWTFDGADEVDPDHNLIKGRGGALFKEKLLICSSSRTFILVDESKQVSFLGSRFPVPIEVFPMALPYVEREVLTMGALRTELRLAKGKDGPVITENGNLILDAWFGNIHSSLEKEIKSITKNQLIQKFSLLLPSSAFTECRFMVFYAHF